MTEGKTVRRINGREVETKAACIVLGNTCVHVEIGTTGKTGKADRGKSGRSFLLLDFRHGDFFVEPVYDGERCVGATIACCGDECVSLMTGVAKFCSEMFLHGRIKDGEGAVEDVAQQEG